MPVSIYQKKIKAKEDAALEKQVVRFYKTGMTTRQIGAIIKRSHEWVARIIRRKLPKAVDRG